MMATTKVNFLKRSGSPTTKNVPLFPVSVAFITTPKAGSQTFDVPEGYNQMRVSAEFQDIDFGLSRSFQIYFNDLAGAFTAARVCPPDVMEFSLAGVHSLRLTWMDAASTILKNPAIFVIFTFYHVPDPTSILLDKSQIPLPITGSLPSTVQIDPSTLPLYVSQYPPPPTDLTTEGIEPNPGPSSFDELYEILYWEDFEHATYKDCRFCSRLRQMIQRKRKARSRKMESCFGSFSSSPVYRPTTIAYPEMDGEGITAGERVENTSNVVLGETQEESHDQASAPVIPVWHCLSSTEQEPPYGHLTDRWLLWKSFEWNTSHAENTLLVNDALPLNFLNSRDKSYCHTPNFVAFNIHAYFRGDMEIKLHVNSNMFQNGMLIMSWLYAADSYDAANLYQMRYSNVALQVQRPHVKVSAGASNEATLQVPYRYVRPYMRCKNLYPNTPGKASALNMGRLTIAPLVQLATGTSADSPKTCGASLFIRFTNTNFTGMYDGTLAKPEMNSVGRIIGNAIGVVDKVIGDLNADDPPGTRPASFFVPQNSQSWSHGTNSYEPTYTLRLDGGRIGVGRSPDIGYSETAIQGIVGVYGMLRPIVWNSADQATNKAGHLLWTTAVHPQCDKDQVYSGTAVNSMNVYTVPPCGVISSMFCYWRGSLNYKFDIVATSKHTGRIIVAYIPGVAPSKTLTLDQAKSSAYVEFSLNEGATTFTFTVPYIADTLFWPRKYGGPQRASDFVAPSTIAMFIINPLVPMESVSRTVTILPFISAGTDFEVAIPAQPSIGLSSNRTNTIPDSNTIQFKTGYYPVYVGEWRNLLGGSKTIFRYGATSDHVAQLTNVPVPPKGEVYYYRPRSGDYKKYITSMDGGGDIKKIPEGSYNLGYGVVYNLDGYNYMIPYPITNESANPGERAAQVVALAISKKKDLSTVKQYIPNWFSDSDYLSPNNIVWEPLVVPSTVNVTVAYPEMDRQGTISREETPNVMLPTALLPTTNDGGIIFGEKFNDMKDYCRRYQLYWEGTVTPGQVRANKRNAAFIQFPILPQGLDLEPTLDNPVWNNMREGHIPLVSSGFRFFRGGVRYRIVITGLNDSIWVQHHPDRFMLHRKPILGSKIHDKDAYRNHSYAFHVQNLSVNRTIVLEIPYYKPGLYNLLGTTGSDFDSKEYASLGDLVIGLEGDQPVVDPIDIAVYYTVADDCSFNVFSGFPAMIYCDEVFPDNAVSAFADLSLVNKRRADDEDEDGYITVQPEMMSIGNFLSSATSSVFGHVAGNVAVRGLNAVAEPIARVVKDEVKKNISPALKDIENTVSAAATDISDVLGKTIPQQAIIGALGQFSQVALNPTPAAIAVAITSMLANFVLVSVELILTVQESLTKFLNSVWGKYFSQTSDLQEVGTRASPEGFMSDMPDKTMHSFLGLVFSAVASTVGLSVAEPKKFPDVMRGVKECLNVCNASVVFFRNIVDAVIYMYRYCLGETSEELKAKIIIEREYPHFKDWCNEVMTLLDPRNATVITHSSRQANRVFDACIYGAKLINDNLDKNLPGGKVIYDLYMKVCKLRDDLIELGNHPDIRFEAFPIWVSGPAGVGKSFMTQQICKEMLEAIDYHTRECMIYWLALGQKYWNGIRNPPVIARDEAYAVGGQFTEEEIATHLAICSSSILNPPMAALQEKNKRLNPLIYYMNSNMEFPQINEARHPEAIYRRRKVMIRTKYTPEILRDYPNALDASDLPPSVKENFAHLQFEMARDPKDKNTTWAGPYTYDAMMELVKQKFVTHVAQERINFRNRMSAAYALDPDYNVADDLNYIHGTTLSPTTLHEQYLEERNSAREILYAAPPTVNDDPYVAGILERFAYLWTPPDQTMPEMDIDPLPSTSGGFFSDDERDAAERLADVSNLDRGAVLKLIAGGMIFDDVEVRRFSISPFFSDLVKSGRVKLKFSVFEKYITTLPECMSAAWKACGWDDSLASTDGKRFRRACLPHWTDCTGVAAIRSYVYWMIRENQYNVFIEILRETNTTHEIRKVLLESMRGFVSEAFITILSNMSTEEEVVDAFERLDNIACSDVYAVSELVFLLKVLNGIVAKEGFCKHCVFWSTNLYDTSKLQYSARYNKLMYRNALGLWVATTDHCFCDASINLNPLFLNAMRIIWNHDHGTIGHEISNPFSFQDHRRQDDIVKSWLASTWDYAKEWWRAVALPYVSMVLTFVYEHFGKIVLILLGLYNLYAVYQHCHASEKVASVVPVVAEAAASATTVARDVLAGALVSVGLAQSEKVPDEVGAEAKPEAPNYFKIDKPKAAMAPMKPAEREGVVDQVAILEQRLRNNVCFLVCRYIDKSGPEEQWREIEGRCLGLRERKVLVLRHYIEDMLSREETASFLLTYCIGGQDSTAFLTREHLKDVRYYKTNGVHGKCNFGVLNLPKYCPMFKNILSSIVRRNEHVNVGSMGHMICMSREGKMSHKYGLALRSKEKVTIAGDEAVAQIRMDISYEYSVHGSGMCGSLLIGENVCRGNPGIFAFHVAGNSGNGYAEPIYREMFEHAGIVPQVDYVLPNLADVSNSEVELDTNLLMYGCVDPKYAHKESGKSKIIPSLLAAKVYPVLTEPNPLLPNDPRQPPGSHPLRDGCNKHGVGFSIPFMTDVLEQVSHDNRIVLLNKVKNPLVSMRELTFQEAICGSTSIPHCEALNWKSSEGFPLSSLRPTYANNKKYLFKLDEGPDGYVLGGISKQLELMIKMREKMRLSRICMPPIYIDCLKDYRLPPKKCAIPGKTRIFSIAPVQVTIDVRRYMGLFLGGYRNAFIKAQHGIGINPDSIEWTHLADYLHEVGDNIVTGDYTNFGPTLSSQIVSLAVEDIQYWHILNGASETHLTHLQHILEYEIVNPFHLCKNLVYQTINGIASGSPITAELNSEVNKYYIKIAFLLLSRINNFSYTLADFAIKCRLVTYGDDFIMSVHSDYLNWFNCTTIAEILLPHGIILTDVGKGARIIPYQKLENSTFLKRGFSPHPYRASVYLAPIAMESVTECVNWCHRQTDHKAATMEVLRASCLLAYGHGPSFYKEHTTKLHVAAIKEGLEMQYSSWKDLDTTNFG